jgi:acyl-coenzyme A synthetase/AMP-(fatty) acid ligase
MYAQPAHIQIAVTFPRTSTGKIDRRAIQPVLAETAQPHA